jgi:hypothetical protein
MGGVVKPVLNGHAVRAVTRWMLWGVVAPATNVTHGVGSAPLVFNQTGVRRFCSEEDGVLHFDPNTSGGTTRTTTGTALALRLLTWFCSNRKSEQSLG